ncbi:MAG: helix-turn-helix domain-containing protein [Prevotella sp.]|jgi:transcriptional regulator with XRE-family HTH domain|nr:helix-turn-helix domain-containing protein [Prevotella sp.]
MEYQNLNELVKGLSPYLNQSALARICGINEGQMRQYISGVRNPSQQTIDRINEGISKFADKLKEIRIKNPDTN